MSAKESQDVKAPEESEKSIAEHKSEAQETETSEIKPKKKDLPIGIVLAILAVALLAIGYLGYSLFLAPPPLKADERERYMVLDTLAKKSGGDITKLSKEELDKANTVTHGFGPTSIRDMAEAKGYSKK
jgi:hypothetical protein